ncbi:MAG: YcxB family protein, partial [Verrucomicrobiota bacterium]
RSLGDDYLYAGVVCCSILAGLLLWKYSLGFWTNGSMSQMLHEGRLDGHLGIHSLRIDDGGIEQENNAGKTISRWEEIVDIRVEKDKAYIFDTRGLGFILPRASVVRGEYEPFVKQAIKFWKNLP